ncbi:hypothetical protein KSD_27700 [Ktedonobacter sp. SOSP1-85]|nr:hypothetical protein KSD_27700 [Ktedonobacter sp. SOSP1-85]
MHRAKMNESFNQGMPMRPEAAVDGEHQPLILPPHTLEQLSDDEFWSLAHSMAETFATPATGLHEQYLECHLRQGRCILPLEMLLEVISSPYHFSIFPTSPPWMLGVRAWREEILPIVDLEAYLTQSVADREAASRGVGLLLIAGHEGVVLGLYVMDAIPIHLPQETFQALNSPASPSFHLPNGVIKGKVEPETPLLDSDLLFQHIIQSLTM